MPIHYGSGNNMAAIYHGSTSMQRVYHGSTLVWENTPPPAFTNFSSTGNRIGNVRVTSNISVSGTLALWDRLLNGDTSSNITFWSGGTGNGTTYLKFDFGYSRVVNGFKWYQSTSNSHGTWAFEGSNDDSNWTQLDSNFTLTGGTAPSSSSDGLLTFTNTTAYRWYRLRHISGTSSGTPYLRQIEFSVDAAAAASTSYANTGGTGDRNASITITATNINAGAGAPTALLNGTQADTYFFSLTGATGNGTAYLKFAFGSAKVIDAFKWYQSTGANHNVWRWEGSNDDSNWTQIGTDFLLGGGAFGGTSTSEFIFGGTTAYSYYRLRHMSGNRTNNPWLREIEFRIS